MPVKMIKENINLLKEYTEKEYEYARLKLFYQISSASTSISKKIIIGLFGVIALLFTSLGLAIWLGQIWNNLALGFLSVGGVYVAITLIVIGLRKNIEKYVIAKISAKYF